MAAEEKQKPGDLLNDLLVEMLESGGEPSKKRKKTTVCTPADVTALSSFFLDGLQFSINGKIHTILEIELYITCKSHPDPFTHLSEVQKVCGKWYFHRVGKNGGYRGGSFKGLDISIGGPDRTGGMLIRTIRRESDKLVITGPSKTVDHILETCGAKSITEFVDEKLKGNLDIGDSSSIFHVKVKPSWKRPTSPSPDVFLSPRFGLNPIDKKGTEEEVWWFLYQPYRFVQQPKLFNKARVNTLLGHYVTTGENLTGRGVINSTGGTASAADKYIDLFNKGKRDTSCLSQNYQSKLSQDAWCKCYGAILHLFDEPAQSPSSSSTSPKKSAEGANIASFFQPAKKKKGSNGTSVPKTNTKEDEVDE